MDNRGYSDSPPDCDIPHIYHVMESANGKATNGHNLANGHNKTNGKANGKANGNVPLTGMNIMTEVPVNGFDPEYGRDGDNNNNLQTRESASMIIYTRNEKVKPKDFDLEVRANMDVRSLLDNAYISLDETEPNLQRILRRCLTSMEMKESNSETLISETCDIIWCDSQIEVFAEKMQSVSRGHRGPTWDPTWVTVMVSLPSLRERKLAIVRYANHINLGPQLEAVKFLIIVAVPIQEKLTKSAYETARTFSTLFATREIRQELILADNTIQVRSILLAESKNIGQKRAQENRRKSPPTLVGEDLVLKSYFQFGVGLKENFCRRAKYYWSDFKDGIADHRSIHKTIAATFYLYFTTTLPCIAFGVVNSLNTHGKIDARRAITGQAIGGLAFALLCGQPLVMIATTAPATLFTKVIYEISHDFEVDFFALFAAVGLFNALFCTLFAVFNVCQLFKWCTRSTEEIFASFSVFVSFIYYAVRDTLQNFHTNYYNCHHIAESATRSSGVQLTGDRNQTIFMESPLFPSSLDPKSCEKRENSLLFVILMLGTFWFGRLLYNFKFTPYLSKSKREMFSDYALPLAVITFTMIGVFVFGDIDVEQFALSDSFGIEMAKLDTLNLPSIGIAAVLGLLLAILFYMDQNITAAYVNRPENKLKKGSAYHLDLLATGLINGVTSLFGFPLMHGILPHAYLQVLALADIEERIDEGHVHQEIIKVRETRLPVIFSHIMIGLSLFAIPYPLGYIPVPVLDGLFLFCAIGMLHGHNLFERITLFFTEQTAYPPTHYIRRCPQRQVHLFTVCQIVQVGLLCLFGFFPWPYMEMIFPIIVALFIPIRHKIMPLIINKKYLDALDGLYT